MLLNLPNFKSVHFKLFISTEDHLWQQLKFRQWRINFETKENEFDVKVLLYYDFKLGDRSRRIPSTFTSSI